MKLLIVLVVAVFAAFSAAEPKNCKDLLGKVFQGKNGNVTLDSMKGKYIGIYFSASYCGACHKFTPKLVNVYNKLKSKGNFEVIWATKDKNEADAMAYFKEMPWPMIPYADNYRVYYLLDHFGLQFIPTLTIIDPDFNLVNRDATFDVMDDPDGVRFPWKH